MTDRTLRLTQRRVTELHPRQTRYRIKDSVSRLQLVVNPSGAKVYRVRGRIGRGADARQFELNIGNATVMPLAEARQQAEQIWTDAQSGVDVAHTQRADQTLAGLLDVYNMDMRRRQIVNRRVVDRCLRVNLQPYLKLPADSLTRLQIVDLIEQLQDLGKLGAAHYFRKSASAFFNWAVNAGRLSANPIAGFRLLGNQTDAARQFGRALSVDELAQLWRSAGSATHHVVRDYVRFLILSGVRRGEAAQLRRDQLQDDDNGGYIWSIPGDRRKTREPFVMPLGPQARKLIDAQLPGSLVFASTYRPGTQLSGWTQTLRKVREAHGRHFTLHDLRRSYRTGWEEQLQAPFSICELAIGHKPPKLISTYSRTKQLDMRSRYQRQWEQLITDAVATDHGLRVVS